MIDSHSADRILLWFGTDPTQFSAPDKWPAVFVEVFFYISPFIFALLFFSPFLVIVLKKKKWTLRNIGFAILQGIALVIIGLMLLFFLAAYLQGKAFEALNGIS